MIEEKMIRDLLQTNYEELCMEGEHPLTPAVIEMAVMQVNAYWKKHRYIAENVMETEVRLYSEQRKLAEGRYYMIEGVVDLVRDGDKTIMYDLKTQTAAQIIGKEDVFRGQLNVYSSLWKTCKDQHLDDLGILALGLPKNLLTVLRSGNEIQIDEMLKSWESEIRVPFDEAAVNETMNQFDQVVRDIDKHWFTAPEVHKLKEKAIGDIYTFATRVCANCDVRFSCGSYQEYISSSDDKRFKESPLFWEKEIDEEDLRVWVSQNLEVQEIMPSQIMEEMVSEQKRDLNMVNKSKNSKISKLFKRRKKLRGDRIQT